MWQVLLAAAAAGSTAFVAKHFLNNHPDYHHQQPQNDSFPETPSTPRSHTVSAFPSQVEEGQDGVFRFSSSVSTDETTLPPSSSSNKKKTKKKKKMMRGSGFRVRVSSGGGNNEVEKRKSGGKFHVCLKRRKTGKNVTAKCGSCTSKDSSLFNRGLGVGIMCMMSAGKPEISKLSMAVNETAKVVNELKTELYRRHSSRNSQLSSSREAFNPNSGRITGRQSDTDNAVSNNSKITGMPTVDDGDYANSDLTEEPEPEVLEMNELEAELESELQKLPWCMAGDPSVNQSSDQTLHEARNDVLDFGQYKGVSPSVLKQKLSHVLIEQQGNQIVELETELQSTRSKLREKEAELQALKDCVKRLTDFSLSSHSDDEMEAHEGEEWTGKWGLKDTMESESLRLVVGMKRPIDS